MFSTTRTDGLIFDETDLLARLRAGDPDAREAFVRRHAGRMLSVARRILRDEDDSADAVQDAFLAAFRSLDAFAGQSAVGTWLHRILVNACLERLRRAARRPVVALDEPPLAGPGDDPLERDEIRAQVRAGIDRLPDDYRTILILRDIEEYDTDETAAALGISRGAVKTRLHRARQALRTVLEPILGDNPL